MTDTTANTATATATNELIDIALTTEQNAGTLWSKAGAIVQLNKEIFDGAEKKDMTKAFTKIMDDNANLDNIPVEGVDRRGEVLVLRKKSKKIKWSSWAVTARVMQNSSDLFKGIETLGYDIVFPAGAMISRYELLALLKEASGTGGETPAETIVRCLELIGKKIPELDKSDADLIDALLIKLNADFSDWKNA